MPWTVRRLAGPGGHQMVTRTRRMPRQITFRCGRVRSYQPVPVVHDTQRPLHTSRRNRPLESDHSPYWVEFDGLDRVVVLDHAGSGLVPGRFNMSFAPWNVLAPVIALSSLIIGVNLSADAFAKALGIDRAQKAPV